MTSLCTRSSDTSINLNFLNRVEVMRKWCKSINFNFRIHICGFFSEIMYIIMCDDDTKRNWIQDKIERLFVIKNLLLNNKNSWNYEHSNFYLIFLKPYKIITKSFLWYWILIQSRRIFHAHFRACFHRPHTHTSTLYHFLRIFSSVIEEKIIIFIII